MLASMSNTAACTTSDITSGTPRRPPVGGSGGIVSLTAVCAALLMLLEVYGDATTRPKGIAGREVEVVYAGIPRWGTLFAR